MDAKAQMIELRWPIVALAAAMIVSAILMSVASYVGTQQETAVQAAKNRAKSARLGVEMRTRERQDAAVYAARFGSLVSQGVVGTERRLDWIELINRLASTSKFASLAYDIGAQQPLSAPGVDDTQVSGSVIQLKLTHAHEGEFLATLDALRDAGIGYYRPERCVLSLANSNRPLSADANVQAECALRWITMRSRNEAAS